MIRPATIEDTEFIIDLINSYPEAIDEGTAIDCEWVEKALSTPGVFTLVSESSVFQFVPLNNATAVFHPCGKGEEAKDALDWIRENTGIVKAVGFVPEDNEKAAMFFLRNGFKLEGEMEISIRIGGKLHNQLIFGREV